MSYAESLENCKSKYPFDVWRTYFDDGLEQYTEENCNRAKSIVDELIKSLISLGVNSAESDKVALFKIAVESFNVLNEDLDEEFIETGEREDICELIDEIGKCAGIDATKYGAGEGLASEWRDW